MISRQNGLKAAGLEKKLPCLNAKPRPLQRVGQTNVNLLAVI